MRRRRKTTAIENAEDKKTTKVRNRAKLTVRRLVATTKTLRRKQHPAGKSEYINSKPALHNKQLIIRFETRAKTTGKAKYPQTIIFHKVRYSETPTRRHPLQVRLIDGTVIHMQRISASKTPVSIRCSCFTGDTRVLLADGTSSPIKDLVGLDSFYVFSYDKNTGKRVIAKAGNAKEYSSSADIVNVTLDNGHVIKCTPDHKFLLNDGTEVQASDLKEGASLSALYRKLSERKGSEKRQGYEQVLQPDGWDWSHYLADEYNERHNNSNFLNNLESRYVRHHVNFNKRDNSPKNILRMTRYRHFMYHSRLAKTTLHRNGNPMKNAATVAKMLATKEARGIPHGNAKFFKQDDPIVRLKMRKAANKRVARGDNPLSNIPYDERNAVKAVLAGTHHTQKPEWSPAKTALRKLLVNAPVGVLKTSQKMADAVGYKYAYHMTKPLKELQEELGTFYLNIVQGKSTEIVIHGESANHKVVSVTKTLVKEAVYCITVPEFGNFAIEAGSEVVPSGVFVKNCPDYYYMWGYADQQSFAHAGPKIKPYVRKTPPPPKGYPEKNPELIPGMCKHIIQCMAFLKKNKVIGP